MPRKPKLPEPRARGQVIPKGPDRWLIRWYIGRDGAGKRLYGSETIHGTAKQATTTLSKKVVAVEEKTYVGPCKQSLVEFLTGYKTVRELEAALKPLKGIERLVAVKGWLGGRQKLSVATKASYLERARRDILPTLGALRLDALSRGRLQTWIGDLVASDRLSTRTVQYATVILKAALAQAVEDGKLPKNPAASLELPKAEHGEMSVLTSAQMTTLLTKTEDPQRKALWTLLLAGGLRPQEALALQWDDLDEPAGTLTVRRALVGDGCGGYVIGPPKTKTGTRIIHLPAAVFETLRAHRTRQATAILAAGATYRRQGYVCAGATGGPLDLSAVRRRWKGDLKALQLPAVRLYDARHSHATTLLAAGVHPKVAQERLGHASVKITMDTYSHVLPSMAKEAAAAVAQQLFPTAVTSR